MSSASISESHQILDGHEGIWNLFCQFDSVPARLEILDWYRSVENLGKGEGLDAVEARLWQEDVEGAGGF